MEIQNLRSSTIKEFVISRVFDVPRELVWRVFTKPEHMKNWWGPKGSTVRFAQMDFRLGGVYHYCLLSAEHREMWGKFVYREIVTPERIVLVSSFSDEKGGLTRHPMNANWPLEMLSTFTFTESEGKTVFTIKWKPINATEAEQKTFEEGMSQMTQGWSGTLDQLNVYLQKVSQS